MEDSSKSNSEECVFKKKLSQRKVMNDLFGLEPQETGLSIKAIQAGHYDEDERVDGLNPEQADMVISIGKYLKDGGTKRFFLVQGGGGTGKSYSINRALKGINPEHVIAAAPSHFAKNVLQDFLGDKYKVTTIASLLGKKVTYDDNGNQILVRINKRIPPPITRYQIILLDEGSMVNDETADEILEYVREGNKALVILGDYCQLPPVNQDEDSLFFRDISAELTIPMRFKGPIFELTETVRAEIIKIRHGLVPSLNILNLATDRVSKITEDGSGYIFLNSLSTVLKAAIRRFKKKKGTGYVRLLAYRNKTIEKLNRHIRVGLYGKDPKQFEDDELLINNGGYSVKNLGGKEKQIITNGELFKVKSAKPMVGPFDIPCVELRFKSTNFDVPIIVVAVEGQAQYDEKLRVLTALAREKKYYWKDVYAFKESFAYFNYSYAASIHKAQGSSINHVFIIEDDILAVKLTTAKEKLQSMYVAISRASFRAYIYNKEFKVNNLKLDREALKKDIVE